MRGIIVWVCILGSVWGVAAVAAGPPFEPEVTVADSRLLQTAMEVSQTNLLAAAAMLETGSRRSAAVAFAAGNLYFQSEDYASAQRAYLEAIGKLPRFRAAKANLGRLYLLQQDPVGTIKLYQDLVSDGQADAAIYLLLGHALQMQARPVSAETAFRQALLLDPEQHDALVGLMQVLFAQDRFQEALALTAELLALQPANRDIWRLRANAFLFLDQHAQAIQTIETAHRLDQADAEMLALQGDLLLNANQPADALEAYRVAFASRGATPERVLRAIEGLLILEDTEGAQAMLETVDMAAWPALERAIYLRLRAQLHWGQQQTAEAEQLAREALQLNPLDGRALLLLADMAAAAGNTEEAILFCERAARIPAYEVDALIQQARIEVSRNRYARAIVLLENAQIRREQPHVGRYIEQLRRMQQ